MAREVHIPEFNPDAHRRNANYPRSVLLKRLLWGPGKLLFRLSPRPLYGFRNALLRCFGAKVGQRVRIYPSCDVFYPWNFEADDDVTLAWGVRIYSLGKIRLESGAMVSQHAHLCAGSHDYTQPNRPLLTPAVTVGPGAWIGTEAFIGPGVTLGEGAIAGARAVVVKPVDPWTIVAGNPARPIARNSTPPAKEE